MEITNKKYQRQTQPVNNVRYIKCKTKYNAKRILNIAILMADSNEERLKLA
jgi:hypothetical protein